MINMSKPIVTSITLVLSVYTCESKGMTGAPELLKGVDTQVMLDNWSDHAKAWQKITFKDQQKQFQIYQKEQPAGHSSIDNTKEFFSIFGESLSPSKKFLILQRGETGTLYLEDGSTKETELSHCEVINMSNGCVMQSRSAAYCTGQWTSDDEWINQISGGGQQPPVLETPSPVQLKEKIAKISSLDEKASIIQDQMYMGSASYLACFPPSKRNITDLNDIAYFLAESGRNQEALEIYKALEIAIPSRMVLKLNMADSLWAENQKPEAKSYYSDYKELMTKSGLTKKIPARVFERISD